tara:strand:- start:259 stop:510 length:252 start_codon:yes stop_codon:yes gene_type:complete
MIMTVEKFNENVKNLKGGESFVYFTGRLSERRESYRDAHDLANAAWIASINNNLGFLNQRKNGRDSAAEIFDYIFTKKMHVAS